MRPKIKICGITNLYDARLAVELGADMLGFNFYRPSPRYIDPQSAAEIVAALPDSVITVGILVNEPAAYVHGLRQIVPLDYVQLHGDEDMNYCRSVREPGVRVIKALRIGEAADLQRMNDYDVDLVLLDAFNEQLYGGAGEAFNWDWLTAEVAQHIILAGGIGPDNIEMALRLRPWGIDLCSGVEAEKGRKDPEKMKALFEIVRRFDES